MKTNFPQRNRAHSSFRGRLIYSGLIFLVSFFFFSYFGSTIVSMLSPIWRSDTYINRGVRNIYMSLRTKDSLIRENELLRENLMRNEELVVSLRSISTNYEELLSLYGRTGEFVPASVLVRPPKTSYDVLVVDAGEKEGVKVGAKVVLTSGASIGTVVEVYSRSSRIRLYSTSGERTNVILERGDIPLELSGKGGGNFVSTLPREAEVLVGDRILTSTLQRSLVGVVGDIEVTPTDAFKTLYIYSPYSPTSISNVVILK